MVLHRPVELARITGQVPRYSALAIFRLPVVGDNLVVVKKFGYYHLTVGLAREMRPQ
jgi:hypothetical protein